MVERKLNNSGEKVLITSKNYGTFQHKESLILMKPILKLGLIIVVIVFLAVLGVGGTFWWFATNFMNEPMPPRLYEVKFDGHVERIEETLREIYSHEKMHVTYTNENLSEAHTLKLFQIKDTIEFEYFIYDCVSGANWINYKWVGCNNSVISLQRIFLNGWVVYDFLEGSKKGIDPYLELFEKTLISKVRVGIVSKPTFRWSKAFNSDSSVAFVYVISEEKQSDTVTLHSFNVRNGGGPFDRIATEKYASDTVVRFDYDGSHIIRKSLWVNGVFIKEEYGEKKSWRIGRRRLNN